MLLYSSKVCLVSRWPQAWKLKPGASGPNGSQVKSRSSEYVFLLFKLIAILQFTLLGSPTAVESGTEVSRVYFKPRFHIGAYRRQGGKRGILMKITTMVLGHLL